MALLRNGSRGSSVTTLQNQLNQLGFNTGKADGIFGNKTRSAVINFQRANKLKVDGIVGNQTLSRINQLITAKKPTAPAAAPKGPVATAPKTPTETPNAGFASTPVQLPYQPVDLNALLSQSSDMLAPLLNQQKATATSTMNSQMQKLSDQWASRGLLASGMAATQQRQATEALAAQLTGLEAQNQADSLQNAYQLGNFQEQQRQFDLGYALEEANVTGKYVPAGTRQLINQLIQQRQIVENPSSTAEQRKAATQQANSIRAALNQMGVTTGNLGASATLQDILNTMSSGNLGTPTQAAREFAEQQGFQRESFNREMGLRERSQAFDEQMQQRVQAFQERQAAIDNQLKQQGIDLDRSRLRLQEMAQRSDTEYREWQMSMGIDEESARRATNSAVAQAMGKGSLDEAYTWLHRNADKFYEDGVDVSAVMAALESKFGMSAGGATGASFLNP